MQSHNLLNFFLWPFSLLSFCSAEALWEHVILADCSTSAAVRISHMAYYAQTLTQKPQTVTVVPTAWNQTADWIRNASEPLWATFPDAAVFSANLSVTQNPGDFAGYGSNGYGTMTCWRFEKVKIYSWYNDVSCNAAYDCNHQGAVGDTADAPQPSAGDDDNGETQKSNKIALGVGLGVGIPSLLVAIIGVWQAKIRGKIPGFHRQEDVIGGENNTGSGSGALFDGQNGPESTHASTIELGTGRDDWPLQAITTT